MDWPGNLRATVHVVNEVADGLGEVEGVLEFIILRFGDLQREDVDHGFLAAAKRRRRQPFLVHQVRRGGLVPRETHGRGCFHLVGDENWDAASQWGAIQVRARSLRKAMMPSTPAPRTWKAKSNLLWARRIP